MAPDNTATALGRVKRAVRAAMIIPIAALAVATFWPAHAEPREPGQEEPLDIRGLLIFKIPFGTSEGDRLKPELGLDFSVSDPKQSPYKQEHFDSRTGAKLPDYDMESVRTWRLEDLERVTEQPAVPEPEDEGASERPAGAEPRIKGLAEYGIPKLADE